MTSSEGSKPMRKTAVRLLGLVVLTLATSLFVADTAGDRCLKEENFVVVCNQICDKVGGKWTCTGENPDRCCIGYAQDGHTIDGCGEGATDTCPECVPGGCSL